jgi:ADP-ribose pyrophosphatase
MSFEILGSEIVYTGRAFSVQRTQVLLPDGRQTTLDLVVHPGAVTLVPVDGEGRIWFVRQYRLGARQSLLELPAGTLEKGEDPQICAGREVREEIGMGAAELLKIGEFYMAPGYSSEFMHVYLATGLFPSPLAGDADEFLQVEKIPAAQVYSMARESQLTDGKTLASLTLARPYLERLLDTEFG